MWYLSDVTASLARRLMSVRGIPTTVLVLLVMGRGALGGAQEPKSDSLRRDSVHVRQCVDCMMLVFPAAALGLAAPSSFLSFIDSTTTPSRREYGNTHLAAYLTGGPVASQNPDLGCTHGQNIEVLAYSVLVDVRVERYYLFPQHLGYVTSHLGFIMPSEYGLAGGITFGYRGVRGPPVIGRQEGIEI